MQGHVEDPHQPPVHASDEEMGERPLPDVSRWLAAASYVCVGCLFVLYEVRQHRRDDEFVRFHARQGFVLCFVEIVLLILSWILGATVGIIPYLGIFLMTAYRLTFGLCAVALSVWGFVQALGGERWELPVLGRYAERVPLD
jgi:uncharacterized membrane protein